MGQRRAASDLPGWPRGLSADLAAAYCGISVSLFNRLVDDETTPQADRIPPAVWFPASRRKVWLRDQLDRYLDSRAGIAPASDDAPLPMRPHGPRRT